MPYKNPDKQSAAAKATSQRRARMVKLVRAIATATGYTWRDFDAFLDSAETLTPEALARIGNAILDET